MFEKLEKEEKYEEISSHKKSYNDCQSIEDEGLELIIKYLKDENAYKYIKVNDINNINLAKEIFELAKLDTQNLFFEKTLESRDLRKTLQETFGDLIVQKTKNDAIISIDAKIENRFTGNLFIETWSNYNKKPGWLFNIKCDYIFYVFLDKKVMFIIDKRKLLNCFYKESFVKCREIKQKKYEQKNDTRGLIVPIKDLKKIMGQTIKEVKL